MKGFLFACSLLVLVGGDAIAIGQVRDVSVSRPFFNPSLGQRIEISFRVEAGSVSVWVLDRDGFLVRSLVAGETVVAGKASYDWDGRDDAGEIVPDEAYSVKIDLSYAGGTKTYFPADEPAPDVPFVANYYDRRNAIFSYRLPKPARVHVQAGIADFDYTTKKTEGPVLKTLVNREPRPAGAVVENWNGLDESGTFYVPDLPKFRMAVAATALPENAIITSGNRSSNFLETVANRVGRSLLTRKIADHRHHRGLSSIEDVAPHLRLVVRKAAWSVSDRVWTMTGPYLHVSAFLEGPSAVAFSRQPGKLLVFVDRRVVRELHSTNSTAIEIELPIGASDSSRIVAINWISDYGPVAVNGFRISGKKASKAGTSISGGGR